MSVRDDSFPRQYARTQRFTLGEPRNVTVSSDGSRVVFVRSLAGDDSVNCLWAIDLPDGEERLVADPRSLTRADDAHIPAAERARRERLREGAGGITSFSLDHEFRNAIFSLGGELFWSDVDTGKTTPIVTEQPVFDPRLSPVNGHIAYVAGDTLRMVDADGTDRVMAAESSPGNTVSWGSADFVAAEEMGRYRGFWFSPDGGLLAACRVDVGDVPEWHIANPGEPGAPPKTVRYPAAGTHNPAVSLHIIGVDSHTFTLVEWDRERMPYLARVCWTRHGLTITVQSRDQHDLEVLLVDPASGHTKSIWADHDDRWVELVPGTGSLFAAGSLVVCADRGGARRLMLDGQPVTPPDLQVRSIVKASADDVVLIGNPIDDATVQHVYRCTRDAVEQITSGNSVHGASAGGQTVLIRKSEPGSPGGRWFLPNGGTILSLAETPLVSPQPQISFTRSGRLATAVLLPTDHDGGSLPVLLDPYGGPHAQRVTQSYNTFCSPQWFADQGFAVVVVDGRGTPGRGSEFERSVHHDLAVGVLEDQVEGLHHAAEQYPQLDLDSVAIRGWSFGGYLAALAVLNRPDVFHAAIAGAPVTEWRLYDTHYTERYLGDPNIVPDVYDANSLLPIAERLTRPLLLVHGLADDNVVAAHTLQLSSALLAAGRPHEVLPLVGVTHMTPQEVVAENLLLHQLGFLRRSLGLTTVTSDE